MKERATKAVKDSVSFQNQLLESTHFDVVIKTAVWSCFGLLHFTHHPPRIGTACPLSQEILFRLTFKLEREFKQGSAHLTQLQQELS
jgi:hypothetical protein